VVCKDETREHWIQRITFAVNTNAADTLHTQRDSAVTDRRRARQYLLRSLSDGKVIKPDYKFEKNDWPIQEQILVYKTPALNIVSIQRTV